jgi:hypothetical protein
MARHGYNCGGAGKHGRPKGPCTYCGKRHPKGKKKKKKLGWTGCINKENWDKDKKS